MSSRAPPTPIRGDHTIIATQRPVDTDAVTVSSRARSACSASSVAPPVRKTPSPKPASPTNTAHGSVYVARTKTPSPVLSNRVGTVSERERRSPKSTDRHSPTQGKSSSSPTEVGIVKTGFKGHARSLSASTTPTTSSFPQYGHQSGRTIGPRSKSQTSDIRPVEALASRVGAEARRPVARRPEVPAVDTKSIATQTDDDGLGLTWGEIGEPLESGMLVSATKDIKTPTAKKGNPQDGFLSQQIRMQAELEMVLRSQMEIIAEHEATRFLSVGPSLKLSTSIRRAQNVGAAATEGGELGSDGECHGEDDEVRSLSLSEDGPVIRRTLSEPSTCPANCRQAAAAPDPIAMLTDGTCTASSALASGGIVHDDSSDCCRGHTSRNRDDLQGRATIEGSVMLITCCPLRSNNSSDSEGSEHELAASSDAAKMLEHGHHGLTDEKGRQGLARNDSENSTAHTHVHVHTETPHASQSSPRGDEFLLDELIPILEKVAGQPVGATQGSPKPQLLEVVQEAPGMRSSHVLSHITREWSPAARLRVPALRTDGRRVKALDLSQVRLPPSRMRSDVDTGCHPHTSARSDLSFGSAQSAFTCWSSSSRSSSSHVARAQTLKGTVSLPTLR